MVAWSKALGRATTFAKLGIMFSDKLNVCYLSVAFAINIAVV